MIAFHTPITSPPDGPPLSHFPELYVNTLSIHIAYRMVQNSVNCLVIVGAFKYVVNFFATEFTKIFRNKTECGLN
jgi:hypothetical protein